MKRAKKLLIVGGVFVIGGVLLVTGWIEYRNSKKLAAEGKAVTAEVTGRDIERGRKGRKSYYVEVQFPTESGASAQRVRVSSSQYEAARPGGTVPVHYLPNDPKVCQVGAKVETEWSGLVVGLGAWILGAFLGFSKTKEKGEDTGSNEGDATAKPDVASADRGSDDQQAA